MSDRLDERIHQLKVVEAGIKRPKPEIPPDADINHALAVMKDDPGAILEPHMLQMLQVMRTDSPSDFARVRQKVKAARSISMQEFDKLTTAVQEQKADSVIIEEVEPWPDPVNGPQLLSQIESQLTRFVVAEEATFRAATLWIVHTWFIDVLEVSPIANITAPEKRCGKTVLLSVMSKLVSRPLQTANTSTAALFRILEKCHPTLLVDEAETFLRENEEARGILNSGFTRDSARVIRCVGDDHEPAVYCTWGAKALCGIGRLADTLEDRSIPLRLRRKRMNETVERLRRSSESEWIQLRRKIARFAQDSAGKIAGIVPDDIPGLNDRQQDCWEPLMQTAIVAGGEWPGHAKSAAIALSGIDEESPSIGAELLSDIQTVFQTQRVDRLFTTELLEGLVDDTEAPWLTWNKGRPMTARQLAGRLKQYSIVSKSIWIGTRSAKGYVLEDFRDSFTRYLPREPL